MRHLEKEGHPKVTHLHWLHVCRTSRNGYCNCATRQRFISEFKFTSESWKKPVTVEYIANVMSYLRTRPRRVLAAFISGCSNLDGYLSTTAEAAHTTGGNEQDNDSFRDLDYDDAQVSFGTENYGDCQRDSGWDQGVEPSRKKRKNASICGKEEVSRRLVKWILDNRPKCAGQLECHPEVQILLGKYFFHTPSKRDISQTAWLMAVAEWNHKPFKDIIQYHYERKTFNNAYYYSIKYSYYLALRLLKNQMNCNKEIYAMIHWILDWADNAITRKTGKFNSLMYFGPSNGGKSLWTGTIVDLLWNVGRMKNANKYTTFPYDDCEMRRLLYWTECRLNSEHVDHCKLILEGSPASADVKFRNATLIQPTPVLIDSNLRLNTYCKPHSDALRNRVKEFIWSSQDFLRHCHRKLNPCLWFYMQNLSQDFDDLDLIPDESHFQDSFGNIVIQENVINMFED